MKCPKCRHEMKRQSIGEHRYRYVCPVCNLIIEGNNEQANESVSNQGNAEQAEQADEQ